MKTTTFLNLSGGVDSTYYLWRWLKENPTENILVHHCMFLKRRLKEEKKATDDVLAWMRANGLSNFKYVETGMQKGTLASRTLDIEMLSGISAIVVKSCHGIKNVLLSYCGEECSALSSHLKKGGTIDTFDESHRYSRINRVMEILTQRTFTYHCYRGKDGGLLTKREMIAQMPKELFEMTWYCRRPVKGAVCGRCHTCKKVQRALKNNKR